MSRCLCGSPIESVLAFVGGSPNDLTITMIWPWLRRKENGSAAHAPRLLRAVSTRPAGEHFSASKIHRRAMPCPVIRWVTEGRIALRGFVFENDADAVCGFQEETYKLNFPDFRYTPAFAEAFRYDLRRASLDSNHGFFVLDDGRETPTRKSAGIAGFLWLVISQNSWSGERFGYINNIYVAGERRGSGLGRELMRQGDDFFRSRGITRVRLTVTKNNQSAVALYRACGYDVERWEMEKDL